MRRNDEYNCRRIQTRMLDFLANNDVNGAAVWTGVDGFGKRGESTLHLGVAVNMPLIIETVDEQSALEEVYEI